MVEDIDNEQVICAETSKNVICHDSDLCPTLVLAGRATSLTNFISLEPHGGSRVTLEPLRGTYTALKLQCDSYIFLDPHCGSHTGM